MSPACFVCNNIRNYANIDVLRPLVYVQGSTKIASSDHQRRGRISWISLTLTVTLTLTLIDSQTPRCAQLVLVERVIVSTFAYGIGVCFYYLSGTQLIMKLKFCLSSMLWRLAICISRCWRMSSILSRIYTSLPSSRDSPRKTCTRFHHLFRKVHRVHIIRFEVTQQVGVAKELTLLALCVITYAIMPTSTFRDH